MTSTKIVIEQDFTRGSKIISRGGRASAQLSPDYLGNSGFEADSIRLRYEQPGKLSTLFVEQRQGLEGDLRCLGAFFRFHGNDISYVFSIVDIGLYMGKLGWEDPISNFMYVEGEHLYFNFDFEFEHQGRSYRLSEGVVDIDLSHN